MSGWTEVAAPVKYVGWWREHMGDVPVPRFMERGPLRALIGREPVVFDDERWHISLSRQDRVPSWDELVAAVHELRPGVVFVIGIPPRSWWMNVHPHTLHAWETTDEHLVGQWRAERMDQAPT